MPSKKVLKMAKEIQKLSPTGQFIIMQILEVIIKKGGKSNEK